MGLQGHPWDQSFQEKAGNFYGDCRLTQPRGPRGRDAEAVMLNGADTRVGREGKAGKARGLKREMRFQWNLRETSAVEGTSVLPTGRLAMISPEKALPTPL